MYIEFNNSLKRLSIHKKEILISSLGNIIEWFDFGLFIFMAPILGAKFFPQASAGNTTIEALIVFAAGFLCRPLGGIFLAILKILEVVQKH